jgi:N-glycosidase YbiA
MISGFIGEYRFLSNFYGSPIEFEGIQFRTVEHAFQAAKTNRVGERFRITTLPTPAQAKKVGRTLHLRSDWEVVKQDVMLGLLRHKFKRGTLLAEKLVATGDEELVEDNHWGDTYWGVCSGRGENHLGRLLMQVREELRA